MLEDHGFQKKTLDHNSVICLWSKLLKPMNLESKQIPKSGVIAYFTRLDPLETPLCSTYVVVCSGTAAADLYLKS